MHRAITASALLLCAAVPAAGQDDNPLNLFVAELRHAPDGTVSLGIPHKLTADEGRNSQPSFTPDGRTILFVGAREGPAGQSDVYAVDLRTGRERRVTRTPENENSPTMEPDGTLLVVRWVPETLFTEWGPWIYSPDGQPLRGLLPGPDTVGYYVRADAHTFALMRPASDFSVALHDLRTGRTVDVEHPVAPLPPQNVPGRRAVSFTRTDPAGRNEIRVLELDTRRVTTLAPALPGRTAHAWTPRGTVLMARGNAVYALDTAGAEWRRIAAFAAPDLQNVTAYAVSPRGDRVALLSTLRVPLHVVLRDSLQAGWSATQVADHARSLREAGRLREMEVAEGPLAALGTEALEAGRADDAVVLGKLVAELSPASWAAERRLGDAHRAAGDTAAAVRHYRRALELNPRATDEDRAGAEALERLVREAG
jgi:dipeptidyl aminopeptidase/acylaminoacyl peptidase